MFSQLTARELEVLPLIADQLMDHEIAELLCISLHTARRHVASILHKLGVERREKAGQIYRREMARRE